MHMFSVTETLNSRMVSGYRGGGMERSLCVVCVILSFRLPLTASTYWRGLVRPRHSQNYTETRSRAKMSSKSRDARTLKTNDTLSSKIKFLDELNSTIRQLKQQLKTFCERRDQVQAEIFSIRSTNPHCGKYQTLDQLKILVHLSNEPFPLVDPITDFSGWFDQ